VSRAGIPDAIEGGIDGLIDGRLHGWARDVGRPDTTIELEILVDGEVIDRAVCDHVRTDLIEAGVGNGRHGFVVPVGDDWDDGLVHEVRARVTGTDLELGTASRVVFGHGSARAGPAPGPFAADTVTARRGSLDAVRERLAATGRLVLVATFQHGPRTPGYVVAYLRALRDIGAAVVVIDTTEGRLAVDDDLAQLTLYRENTGWDFASWLAGLHEVRPVLDDARELVLTNDSVFGPLYPLHETFEHPRVRDADFWGLTDGWEIGYHLQSYFLVLRRSAFTHLDFWRYLADYPFPVAKRNVIRDGELGLTRCLVGAGLRPAVTCPYDAVARRWLDTLGERLERVGAQPESALYGVGDLETAVSGRIAAQGMRHVLEHANLVRRGIGRNASHFFWDTLIRDFRFPFVKRELLLLNPAEIPLAADLREVLADTDGYDLELIREAARLYPGPVRVPTL